MFLDHLNVLSRNVRVVGMTYFLAGAHSNIHVIEL